MEKMAIQELIKPKNKAIVLINIFKEPLPINILKTVESKRKLAVKLAIISQERIIETLKEYGTISEYENEVLKELINFNYF